ncbi:NAD(P)-dependent oxidoreductase [Niallia circulans]|uniref:Hydroxyacid dehydrogenase n=1 Tax=Niallia circulans TaxID=1397 RepID=A0A941GFZ4_NIACI|nr:hydroxyacid dehydrogenase [Niallia circulans]MCB5239634.1 hydroxyacid dehydrogenase [Niallia circulans]
MKKPRVLQILPMYHEAAEKILNSGAEVVRTDDYSIKKLCELVKDVDAVVLRAPARIERDVIDANPQLKVISGAGVGLDNIDVAYATERGIPVLHAPSVNKVSTAEHTVMFIMALSKSLLSFHKEMEKGNFNSRNLISTQELKGKKVGLIGFGSIAQEVAKRLVYGLDMKVSAWVREYDSAKHGTAKELGVEITKDLKKVFSESDFVSIHIPLNEETKYSIDDKVLSLMKSSAYLINTARGAVINQEDLYNLLSSNKIAGAGLDVYEVEPIPKDSKLLTLSNVLLTPHVGGTTQESNYITATTVAKNIINFLNGEDPEFIANPSVLSKSRE